MKCQALLLEMVMDHLAKIDDIAYVRFAVCIVNYRQNVLKGLERMSMIMDSQKNGRITRMHSKEFHGHSISLKTVSLINFLSCGLPKEINF